MIGPSGSGKSTMLNMLGTLDNPYSGEIIIDGINLGNEKDLSDFRRDTLGFIFQLHNLLPNLSIQENVEIPLVRTKLSEKEKLTASAFISHNVRKAVVILNFLNVVVKVISDI